MTEEDKLQIGSGATQQSDKHMGVRALNRETQRRKMRRSDRSCHVEALPPGRRASMQLHSLEPEGLAAGSSSQPLVGFFLFAIKVPFALRLEAMALRLGGHRS